MSNIVELMINGEEISDLYLDKKNQMDFVLIIRHHNQKLKLK